MIKNTENSTRYGGSVSKKTTFVVILTVLVALFIFIALRGTVAAENGGAADIAARKNGNVLQENGNVLQENGGLAQGNGNTVQGNGNTVQGNATAAGADRENASGWQNGAVAVGNGGALGNGIDLVLTAAESPYAAGCSCAESGSTCAENGTVFALTDGLKRPRIVAFNLSLADSVYIDYAVWTPEGCDGFGILVWERNAPENYTHGTGGVEVTTGAWQTVFGGESVWVFAYRGIVMKEFADDVYAVPFYKIDGAYVYGEVQKFSVVQYALMQKENANLAPLISSILELGAQAQRYFNYRTDRLADSEFVKVSVHGGLLPDKSDFGLFLPERDTLPVPTPPEGETGEFDGWYADAAFTERLAQISPDTTDAYAKRVEPSVVLAKTDFTAAIGPSTAPLYTGGVSFNSEYTATVETLRDENGTPYLKILSGRDTTVQISASNTGLSFADMLTEDVFSFTVILGAVDGKRVLSTAEFGICTDKNKSGKATYATLNLLDVDTSGAVSTHRGAELGTLSSSSALAVRVTVDFAKGELTYYGALGEVTAREAISVPSGLGVSTPKEWQSLMEKYMLFAAFDGGNAIRVYEISVATGNAFSA